MGGMEWSGQDGSDVAYLDYTKCIAVALVGDMILGLLALGTDQIITIKKGPRYGNY